MTEHDWDIERALPSLAEHADCAWEQIGLCVYCTQHGVRLYQGTLPENRRQRCDRHEWDEEIGLGFYFQCKRCGAIEWPED